LNGQYLLKYNGRAQFPDALKLTIHVFVVSFSDHFFSDGIPLGVGNNLAAGFKGGVVSALAGRLCDEPRRIRHSQQDAVALNSDCSVYLSSFTTLAKYWSELESRSVCMRISWNRVRGYLLHANDRWHVLLLLAKSAVHFRRLAVCGLGSVRPGDHLLLHRLPPKIKIKKGRLLSECDLTNNSTRYDRGSIGAPDWQSNQIGCLLFRKNEPGTT
jgi:hypothetical protein